MVDITVELISKLREITKVGPMDCKKALIETGGNLEEAVDYLRKKGIAKAEKSASRIASEGLIGIKTSDKEGVIGEINCETDFVVRNEGFQTLCKDLLEVAFENKGNGEMTLAATYPNSNKSVTEVLKEKIAAIGENITLRRLKHITVDNGVIVSYIHNGMAENLGNIGVLVAIKSSADQDQLRAIGKQIAMHIAASSPKSLNIEGLDPALVEKEKEIAIAKAESSGKPANVIEKMVEGGIRKFFEEVVLLEQILVMDGKTRIKDFIESHTKELGTSVEISGFVYYKVGEGIEKEVKNFADEVAAATKGK